MTLPTPGTVRAASRRRPAQPLAYAFTGCTLGTALVAAGDAGVRAVLLGDDRDALLADLQRRFPAAALVEGGGDVRALAGRVARAMEDASRADDVALDPAGTAFQRDVWRALRDIPAGTTSTYTEIARRIGRPASVRAVAQACAANPIAVIVPCHRVLRSDGGLSGYRWGVERKRALLEREGRL